MLNFLDIRAFDKNDPVKYDFALFGLGVFEGFWDLIYDRNHFTSCIIDNIINIINDNNNWIINPITLKSSLIDLGLYFLWAASIDLYHFSLSKSYRKLVCTELSEGLQMNWVSLCAWLGIIW